jgi:hypothetical protein
MDNEVVKLISLDFEKRWMMKKHRVHVRLKLSCALLLCGGAVTCVAQPAMSRGQQQLPINNAECLNRARQSLRNVGFSDGGAGNFGQGFKEASGAYIICNDAPGGGVFVNIVVASSSNDANVPGKLRQLLQAQMEKPGASSPPPTGGMSWERVGEGDCSGGDVGETDGFTPRDDKTREASTAVCWDGKRYNNSFKRSGQAFCTYKSTLASACHNGNNTGALYRTVRR